MLATFALQIQSSIISTVLVLTSKENWFSNVHHHSMIFHQPLSPATFLHRNIHSQSQKLKWNANLTQNLRLPSTCPVPERQPKQTFKNIFPTTSNKRDIIYAYFQLPGWARDVVSGPMASLPQPSPGPRTEITFPPRCMLKITFPPDRHTPHPERCCRYSQYQPAAGPSLGRLRTHSVSYCSANHTHNSEAND